MRYHHAPCLKDRNIREKGFAYTFLMKHPLPFEFRINTDHVFTFNVHNPIHHQCFLQGENTCEKYYKRKGLILKTTDYRAPSRPIYLISNGAEMLRWSNAGPHGFHNHSVSRKTLIRTGNIWTNANAERFYRLKTSPIHITCSCGVCSSCRTV